MSKKPLEGRRACNGKQKTQNDQKCVYKTVVSKTRTASKMLRDRNVTKHGTAGSPEVSVAHYKIKIR